jgi:hypothetical protein
VTAAIVNRTRWFKRLWLLAAAVVVLVGIVAFATSDSVRDIISSIVGFSLYGVTSGEDLDEANVLEAALIPPVTAIHHFTRNSVLQPDSPPISVTPGSQMLLTQRPEVTVYGIRDRGEQDRVIAAVQAVVRDRNFKPLDLCFMDHENWNVHGNVGERGPELQLRRVRIAQSGTREDGGKKTITYPW